VPRHPRVILDVKEAEARFDELIELCRAGRDIRIARPDGAMVRLLPVGKD